MKQNYRLLLCALLLTTLLTSCGLAGVSTVSAPTAAPVEPTATQLPRLRVGLNAQYAPFAFVDDKGNVVGFEVDLLAAIARQAGFEVEYVDSPWGVLFRALDQGEFGQLDAIMAAISITPEKQQVVNFSDPYFNAGQVMVIKAGSSWQRPDQLKGQRIGVLENTTSQQWVGEHTAAEVVPFATVDQVFTALGQGEVAAVINDGPNSAYFIRNNPQAGLTIVGSPLTQELYGIAVSKNKPDFLATINSGLSSIILSGEYAQICAKWFGTADNCRSASTTPVETAVAITPPVSPALPPTSEVTTASPTSSPANQPEPVLPLLSCKVAALSTQPEGRIYEIQTGDWLSSLAEREYGNPLDYRAIVAYSNQMCQTDPNVTCLNDPDRIEVGWRVYLPSPDQIAAYWSGQLVSLPPLNFDAPGNIAITGSSTVYLLTRQLAACFQEQGFAGGFSLTSSGTLAGFESLCRGQADLANASHRMRPEDRQLCQSNGYEPIELQVGTDALVVVVSSQNDFVADITEAELRQILSTATTWSEVRPKWPNQPIRRFYPTDQSGTFLFLVEQLFEGRAEALLQAPHTTVSEEDAQLISGVQNDPLAIGFFGYAYYQRNAASLRALPVNGIQPRPETVDQGTYPLIRPLFLYSTGAVIKQKPQVAAFLNYYLQLVRNYIVEVGYFLPDEEAFQETIRYFNQAKP